MKAKSIKKYRSVGGKNIKIVSSKKKASSKKGMSKRNKLTTKRSGKSLEKGGEDTMCTKYVKKDFDYLEGSTENLIKILEKKALEIPDLEKRKLLQKATKDYKNDKKKQNIPRYLKKQIALCQKNFFNPTCDGGDVDVDDIIKDGFNTKLHPDDVKQFKRDGATSGCQQYKFFVTYPGVKK